MTTCAHCQKEKVTVLVVLESQIAPSVNRAFRLCLDCRRDRAAHVAQLRPVPMMIRDFNRPRGQWGKEIR